MSRIAIYRTNRSLLFLAATVIGAACSDGSPVGLKQPGAFGTSDIAAFDKKPDLGTCDSLRVPERNKLVLHAFASGVQIYQWTGSAWSFVAPAATLFANKEKHEPIGTHFAGPTWESTSGSKVVGATLKRCTPDANSIPWLLLQAVSTSGHGIFEHVTFIQRLNTVGGNAPANPGTTIGETANVPYTAEYFFYRAK